MKRKVFKRYLAAVLALVLSVSMLVPLTNVMAANVSESKEAGTNTLWIVGDSTVCSFNDSYYYPRYGYGTQIENYLDNTYNVQNLAASGRSSLSYMTAETSSDYYATLMSSMTAGDVLMIGFGHNDQKAEADRYTNPNGDYTTKGSFEYTLYTHYVKPAMDKGVEVILCTPIVRRDEKDAYTGDKVHVTKDATAGGVTYPGGDYAQAIRDLGAAFNLTVIDLTNITKDVWQKAGAAETLYMHSWTSSNEKSVDNTHINIYGAKKVAYLLANALKSTSSSLASHVVLGEEPTKENSLVSNPDYVEPDYDNTLPESELWKDYGIFKGTAFGDTKGESKIKGNYTIGKDAAGNMRLAVTGNAGGIQGAKDGIGMYYYKVPTGSTFSFSATATINAIDLSSTPTQNGFGLMARDDMYIDTYDTAIASDYVVAGTLGDGKNCFYRKDGTLTKKVGLTTETIAKGKSYDLSIVSNSDGYACTFGNEPTQSAGYDFMLTSVDPDYVYIGMFVARNIDVSFSNIKLTIDGKEINIFDASAGGEDPVDPVDPVDPAKNGLLPADDGNWYLYKEGVVDTTYTGLYNDANVGWWLVEGGKINFGYTGLYNDATVGWWYVEGGTINFNYTGLYCDANVGWWLVMGGRLCFEYTGLYCDANCGWWLVGGGRVCFEYSGLYGDANCGWWLVEGGAINFNYAGLYCDANVGWWLVEGGTISFGYTGLAYDPVVGWWYVEGGAINFGYTGPVAYNGGTFNVVNGMVVF